MKYHVIICTSLFFVFSCNSSKKESDTPIKGTINVLVDETYKPLIDSEKMIFESHYKEAKVNLFYRPAVEVMEGFANDSFRVLISSIVPDTNALNNFFTVHKFKPKTVAVGKDAVAIVTHNSKKGLQLRVSELQKILSGAITDFSQIKGSKYSGKINLVFDNNKSSTLIYMQDEILKGKPFNANAYAQQSNEEVMDYVSKNTNALGVIGVSWISDEADENSQKFTEKLAIVEIGEDNSPYFYKPQQAYIALHKYPLRRLIQVTVKEGGARLGSGFTNFLTGEYGQKIILSAGLVPAVAQTRVVMTK
jgi:phosphate transport system substrate-binding protein